MSACSDSGADEEEEEVEKATEDDDDKEDDGDDEDIADLSELEITFAPRQCRVSNPAIDARCNCNARQQIASIGHCSCDFKPLPLTPPSS